MDVGRVRLQQFMKPEGELRADGSQPGGRHEEQHPQRGEDLRREDVITGGRRGTEEGGRHHRREERT